MTDLDRTHEPSARSWIAAAPSVADFPLQNLPFGVFRRQGTAEAWRGGVAIEDKIVDLSALSACGLLTDLAAQACRAAAQPSLNDLLAMGRPAWRALRHALFDLLCEDASASVRQAVARCLLPQAQASHEVPVRVGNYTDFYTSIHHACNVGRVRHPDYQLPANFRWMPIAYHGRASTVVVSGTAVRRPWGQWLPEGATEPQCGPSRKLDFELELGAIVGTGNRQGEPIPLARAQDHLFGLCLLNDWSARDLQFWESAPLGPFLGKNFATSVSPWIVTLEALAPFRAAWQRTPQEPAPLAYLDDPWVRAQGGFDIGLEVHLQPAGAASSQRLCATNFQAQYWTFAQMVAHHTVGGCSLEAGDLIGSGTVSGPRADEAGAMIELSLGGRKPIMLAQGGERSFLEDGDQVVLRGRCERPGRVAIGFGACAGTVVANQSATLIRRARSEAMSAAL